MLANNISIDQTPYVAHIDRKQTSVGKNKDSHDEDDVQMDDPDGIESTTTPIISENISAESSEQTKPPMMVLSEAIKSVINSISIPIEHLMPHQTTTQSDDTNVEAESTSDVQYPKLPDVSTATGESENANTIDLPSMASQVLAKGETENNEIQSSAVVNESLYPALPSTSNDFHVQSAESYEEQQTEVDSDYEDAGASVTVSRLVIGGIHAEESMGSTVQLSMRSAGLGLASRQSREDDSKVTFTKSRLGEEVMTADDESGEDPGDMSLKSDSEDTSDDVEVIDLDEMEYNEDDGEEVDFDQEDIEEDDDDEEEEDVNSESDSQLGLPTNKNYKLTSEHHMSDQDDSNALVEEEEQDASSEDEMIDDAQDDLDSQEGSDHDSGEDTENR